MRKLTLLLAIFLTTTVSVAANLAGDGLVISEVQIDSVVGDGGVEDDWVELYNPTSAAVDLSGYSLQKMNSSGGSFYRKALSSSIPAYGFFLVVRNHANTSQDLKDTADVLAASLSFSLSEDNIIYLVSNNEDIEDSNDTDIVDFVGFGLAPNFEGETASPNPTEGGSIERKSGEAHDDSRGNGWDTNQNFDNFFNQPTPNPQNSSSEIESPIVEEADTTPPVTTVSVDGGFYGSAQTVGLTTNEEATIYYTFESEDNFLEYSVPLEIAATVTFRFYSKDSAENEEEVQTESYTIDSDSPVFEEGAILVAEAGDELVILTWSAASDENFEGYFLRTNGDDEESLGDEVLTFTKTGLTNGVEYNFILIARDAAGNATTLSASATPNGPTIETVADSGEVIFSEIAWAGSTASSSDEWLELKNTTSNKIFNLDGWKIVADDGSPEILLSGEIQPGGFFLLERTDDDSVPTVAADQIYTGSLSNDGEILILKDSADSEIDRVDGSHSWEIGGDSDTKKTLACLDSENFRTSFEIDGTPRAANFRDHDIAVVSISAEPSNPLPDESIAFIATIENRGLNSETADLIWKVDGVEVSRETITDLASFDSLEKTFTQTFAAGDFVVSATLDFSDENSDNNSSLKNLTVENHLVINEFLPNPEGADPGNEWIELFNPTDLEITLDGFKINSTTISGSIEQNGFFVLDNFDGLVNSSDEVVLINADDEIIDSKSYENAVEKKSFGRSSDDLTVWTEFFHPTKNAANIEENELPTAVITIQGSGNSSGGCSLFVNLTAEDSTDADGDDLEFEWDFDNGSTSDDSNPAGFYLSAGDYAVTLTVTDPLGGSTEVTQNFTVSGCGSGGGDSAKESLKKETTDEPVFDSISAERVILQINEVSVDSKADWIELRMLDDGNSGHGIDIGGFYFEDDKRIKTIPQNTKLKSGDFLTLTFKSEEEDWNSVRDGVWQIFTTKSGLTKTDEQIILRDSSGQIEDAIVWENRDGKWSRGEEEDVGLLVTVGAWVSKNFEDAVDSSRIKREVVIARQKNSADSNSQADWFLTPFATPGAVNSAPPVRAGDFQFFITEIQPKNPQGDFVKIECPDCSTAVSLNGFFLKSGTRDEIFRFPADAQISSEQPVEIIFHSLVDQFSNNIFTSTFLGLVASDGLLTLKDFENTTADFVGWSNRQNPPTRDSDLSDNEITQLEKRFRNGEWDGEVEASLLDSTEFQREVRLLRQNLVDTNSAKDWEIQNPEIPLDEIAITIGDIRISEILPNPVGSDADNEWFELVNLGDSAVDLLGWSVSLNKAFYEFEESTLLQPGEFKAFHGLFSLRNTGGTLSISDPEGDLIDSLEYPALREGEAFARNVRGEFFATELPTPDVTNGFYKTLSSTDDGDADGLSDEEEIQFQTNPEAFDSDGDILSDAFEIHNGFDPNIPDATEEALQKFRQELQALAALNLICQANGENGVFLAGSGIPGGKVRIYIHSELQIVEVPVNAEGGWSYVLDKSLEAGSHNIFTQLVSPNGFTGVASKVMSFELQKPFQPPIFAEDLRFSEVLPNPVGEDSVAEWLEIENFGSEIADLSNFQISIGRKNFIFPEDSKISVGGFLLISREESGITLPNSGGEISLATPTNRMIAELTYPKVAEGIAFAWDGSAFRATQTLTPAAANSILMLTKKSSAKKSSIHKNINGNLSTEIRISEILPNPVGADSREFIELENFGSVAVNLGNWRISDAQKTFTIPDSIILQPGEFRSFPKSLTKISLNNSGDEVSLSDFRDELISFFSFHSLPEGVSFSLENSDFRETTIPTANSPNQFDSQKISGLIRFVGADGFVVADSDGEFFVNFGETNSALLARALLRTGERWEIFATNFTGGFTLKNFTVAPDLFKSDLITLPSSSPVSSDRAWIFAFVVFLAILLLLRFARTDAIWETD